MIEFEFIICMIYVMILKLTTLRISGLVIDSIRSFIVAIGK